MLFVKPIYIHMAQSKHHEVERVSLPSEEKQLDKTDREVDEHNSLI